VRSGSPPNKETERNNKNDKNDEMTSLSIDDLDVSELESSIELAAQTAECSCNGGCTGKCDSNTIKGIATAAATGC
jgi:hypothetical protein